MLLHCRNWDSNLTAVQAPPACKAAGPPYACCWLKNCNGQAGTGPPCAGTKSCTSWSGHIPRPPPPPPHCPAGTRYVGGFTCATPQEDGNPKNAGLPDGYDCEARQHAWMYAKATLPSRGSFKTAFDALQLHTCPGTPSPPSEGDVYVPPNYPTPTEGTVIYADASSPNPAGGGGDGSKPNPFTTLDAAVVAAANSTGSATIVLRAGTYALYASYASHAAHASYASVPATMPCVCTLELCTSTCPVLLQLEL